MAHIALLDSGVWASGFLKKVMFHPAADKLISRLRREIEQGPAANQA